MAAAPVADVPIDERFQAIRRQERDVPGQQDERPRCPFERGLGRQKGMAGPSCGS